MNFFAVSTGGFPGTRPSAMAGLDEPTGPQSPDHGSGSSSAGSALLDRQEQMVEPGDHERFAHYVEKAKITASALSGEPVIALCGKVWVPGRDPSKFPVCPECKEIHAALTK